MSWIEAGIILGLILLNGFFAGSELALVSARKSRLRARAERGDRGAGVALQLMEDPTRWLSSIQIGITLIGILTGVYSGAVLAEHLGRVLQRIPWLGMHAGEVAFTLVVVGITYLSLIFGELVPKRIALAHPDSIAARVARPMLWMSRLTAPLVWVLQTSTEAVAKMLPTRSAPQASITEDELKALIATGTQEGVFHRDEKDMVEGVLRLADHSVESIMTPRVNMIWLDATESLGQLWSEARSSGHARFLLSEGEVEQVLGVITLADLGEALRLGRLDRQQHLRPPLYVPNTISVLRLLQVLRNSTVHLAVVTDEYGSIEGLVTPADILRAIAGELPETGSRERAEAIQRDDGSWLVDAQLSIHEAERVLNRADLSSGDDYHTVAGFVLWHLGRLPVAGETLSWRDLRIEVVDMDDARIDKVLISRRSVPQQAARLASG